MLTDCRKTCKLCRHLKVTLDEALTLPLNPHLRPNPHPHLRSHSHLTLALAPTPTLTLALACAAFARSSTRWWASAPTRTLSVAGGPRWAAGIP